MADAEGRSDTDVSAVDAQAMKMNNAIDQSGNIRHLG